MEYDKLNRKIDSVEENIQRLEKETSDLYSKFDELKNSVSDLEKEMIRVNTEASQVPDKLKRLPDAKYLDEMIDSVGDKMEDKINSVSESSISRRELYSYAALISFFVSLIIGIGSFFLTYYS